MAAQRKPMARSKGYKLPRAYAVPRMNPKNGPPVYITEGGEIPIKKLEAAVRAVLAARGKLAENRKSKT